VGIGGKSLLVLHYREKRSAMAAQYVCTGTCGGSVSEAEYGEGKTTCGTLGCSRNGQPFTRREKAEIERAGSSHSAGKKPWRKFW